MKKNLSLQTGDILHCHGKTWVSKAIRWFTKSWVNHTAVVVEVWGHTYIVDAQKNGVNPKPLEAWLKEYNYEIIVARPKTGPKDPRTFSIRAFMKVGLTGYDYNSLIFRHPWAIITKKWARDKDTNDKRMVCSEYVAWLYQVEKPYRITPKKLYDYTKRGEFHHYLFTYKLELNSTVTI